MNQKHRELQDENWTHVKQLKSNDKREKVLEDSNHVWKNQVPQFFFKFDAGDLVLVPLMRLLIFYFLIH